MSVLFYDYPGQGRGYVYDDVNKNYKIRMYEKSKEIMITPITRRYLHHYSPILLHYRKDLHLNGIDITTQQELNSKFTTSNPNETFYICNIT